jgi:hypothetical protein
VKNRTASYKIKFYLLLCRSKTVISQIILRFFMILTAGCKCNYSSVIGVAGLLLVHISHNAVGENWRIYYMQIYK